MKIYVSNYLSNSISVIDYSNLKLERTISLNEEIYPHHFCIDRENNIAYIPSSSDGMLYILDFESKKIKDTISVGGNLSQIVICNEEIFISNEDSNSIYILDKNLLCPIGMISVDNMPHGFAFDKQTNNLYVPCRNSIICIDVINKNIKNKIDTDFKSWHIKVDEKTKDIYTTTLDGKIVILDNENLMIKEIIEDFLLPIEIVFSYKNEKIYVSDLGYKSIKVLDYNTREHIHTTNINGNPQGLEISADEEMLFVSDTLANKIRIYDSKTYKLIKSINVEKEPTTIICM